MLHANSPIPERHFPFERDTIRPPRVNDSAVDEARATNQVTWMRRESSTRRS